VECGRAKVVRVVGREVSRQRRALLGSETPTWKGAVKWGAASDLSKQSAGSVGERGLFEMCPLSSVWCAEAV
jgi:hypothetical protein